MHTGGQDKADILNRQFSSVFTSDSPSDSDKHLHGPSYPVIGTLHVHSNGVEEHLAGINPSKAAGPDSVPCRILKELSSSHAPVLTAIFQQSLDTGVLPTAWSTAYVTPVFKKGSSSLPENYRPVSLTCVACKIFEHIVCSHVRAHLGTYNILSWFQHGFRAMYSCETQLLTTIQDLLTTRDRGTQLDVAVLDFSKAFDKVPHQPVAALRHRRPNTPLDCILPRWTHTASIGRR